MKQNNALQIAQALADSIGAELLPDGKGWMYRIQIRSESSNKLYVISKATGAQADKSCVPGWGCGCQGWIHHRKCKHLTAMQPALVAIDAAHAQLTA